VSLGTAAGDPLMQTLLRQNVTLKLVADARLPGTTVTTRAPLVHCAGKRAEQPPSAVNPYMGSSFSANQGGHSGRGADRVPIVAFRPDRARLAVHADSHERDERMGAHSWSVPR
jgi:hypothetical protein